MEYVGGTSKRLWLVRILVLRFVIPEACMYSLSLCFAMMLKHDLLLIVFLMSGGRGRAMVFSYQSIPLGACVVVLCFEG